MAKPIIKNTLPFDAQYEHTFSFVWSGNRAYHNRLIIYDAETLSIVYDRMVESFNLHHILPGNALENGLQYIAQCQIVDGSGEASSLSDKIFFKTLETPLFQFNGLSSGDKIDNASYPAMVQYDQANGELLRACRFYLYGSAKDLIVESEELYNQSDISYVYRGLETDTTYYVRCIGSTVNGMELDTGYIEIYVQYKNPTNYATIYAENVPNKGYIKYNTNIIVIQYNGEDIFEYDDGKIILSGDKKIYYDKGFKIANDFTLKIKGTNLYQSADIFEAKNEDEGGFKISSYIYDDRSLRFKLISSNGLCDYIIYSEPLYFTNNDFVTLVIRRINNIYQINAYVYELFKIYSDHSVLSKYAHIDLQRYSHNELSNEGGA